MSYILVAIGGITAVLAASLVMLRILHVRRVDAKIAARKVMQWEQAERDGLRVEFWYSPYGKVAPFFANSHQGSIAFANRHEIPGRMGEDWDVLLPQAQQASTK